MILTIYPPHLLPSRQPASLAFLLTRKKLNFLGWIFFKGAACLTPCSFPFSLYFSWCALCTIWKPKVKDDRMNLTLAAIATFASFAVHLWSVILLWKVVLHIITCLIQRHGTFFKLLTATNERMVFCLHIGLKNTCPKWCRQRAQNLSFPSHSFCSYGKKEEKQTNTVRNGDSVATLHRF